MRCFPQGDEGRLTIRMDTLLSMKVFRLVAELKSFAAAADRLGMSPAMVSKHVMHLERRLSTRLLNRTSRHVSLSESGTLYFEQSRLMLDALEEVEAVVSKATVVPHGTLKLSAPVWMANSVFVGLMADYRARYPDVHFDVDLSGRLVNLVDEGFDLTLRATHTPHEGVIARPIAKIRFHLVAAPSYLEQNGHPRSVSELDGHRLLLYTLSQMKSTIVFGGPKNPQTIKFVPVLQTDNETLLHLAAVEGMGMAFLPRFLIAEDLAAKRLELLLPERFTSENTFYGVYPSRKYLSAKVRTFLDFIAEDPRLN
jgi:DNA-binding transcriptional LysR family regulator